VRLVAAAVALIFCVLFPVSSPVHAQDLNQQYGPSWNCLSIDARLTFLYQACLPCQQAGQDFYRDTDTSGHCVPKAGTQAPVTQAPASQAPVSQAPASQTPIDPSQGSSVSPAQAPPSNQIQSRSYWGATAAAIWQDSSRTEHVASGVAWDYATQAEAIAAAIADCQKGGGGSNCKSTGTFSNGGCGYISVGNSGGKGGVCWGTSSTAAVAVSECQSKGCTCKPADGGCTKQP
jgi:hypothetical protein